jgi:restriction system protein
MVIPGVRRFLFDFGITAIVWLFLTVWTLALVIFIYLRHNKPFPVSNTASTALNVSTTSGTKPVHTTTELIEQLRLVDWFQFEKIVDLVYQKHGYNSTRRGGASPDGGIDLVIEKDGQKLAVQCKQWKTWKVGVKPVREFLGALKDAGIERGVFVTLNGYSEPAKQLADKHGIEMLNETELAKMLGSVDAQHDPEILALLNDERKFCPKCDREMKLRTAAKGPGIGQSFWGCSAFPRCRFTMRATVEQLPR